LAALSRIEIVADCATAAAGVKVTAKEHDSPAARVPVVQVLLAIEKDPGSVPPTPIGVLYVTVSGDACLLLSVTVFVALCCPTTVFAKLSDAGAGGAIARLAALPTPLSAMLMVGVVAESVVTVRVAV